MKVHSSRSPARISWIIVAALPAAILLLPGVGSTSRTETDGEPGGKLEVVLATPTGERLELYSIDVTFSEPMVSLGERGKRADRGPIRFEPKLSGSFTWLGTRTVSFVMDSPPPPGTRITCTLPKGTRAVSGRRLAEDHTWTILFRPARLNASLPQAPVRRVDQSQPPPVGRHLPGDPILLAFDRPLAGKAPDGILLESEDGMIALHEVAVLPEHLQALRRQNRNIDSLNVTALRPMSPIERGKTYSLVLSPSLRFKDSPVGLPDALVIPFRVPGQPRIRGIDQYHGGIRFKLESPVDPDTFLAHLRLQPRPEGLRARAWSTGAGEDFISVVGEFLPGRNVDVLVPAGLRDLSGYPMEQPYRMTVKMAHANAVLRIDPDGGVILTGPDEFLRLSARNTSPVRIRWVWVTSAEMPLFEAASRWDGPARASRKRFSRGLRPADEAARSMPWESRWRTEPDWPDPSEYPDSLCRWERRLIDFTPRPRDAQLLLLEATSTRSVESTSSWQPDTLVASTGLQTTRLGISSRQGVDQGLIWVTDLLTGLPAPDAAVSLWNVPLSDDELDLKPLWTGSTDQDGICRLPGILSFDEKDRGRIVRAESAGHAVSLRLSDHYGSRPIDKQSPNSAFVLTDRPIYRPGETIRWKGVVRHSDRSGLTAVDATNLSVVLSGWRSDDIRLPVRLTPLGNPYGEIEIPENAPTGSYSLHFVVPEDAKDDSDGGTRSKDRTLTGTSVQIESFRAPRFKAQVGTTTPLVVSGEDAHIAGSFAYFSGPPLSGQPVVWRTMRRPARWSPPGWDKYRFWEELSDHRRTLHSPEGPSPAANGESKLDLEGRLDLHLPFVLPPEAEDSQVTVEVGARDLADQSAYARTDVTLVRGPYRPGVRTVIPKEGSDAEGAWDWIVVDTGGSPVEGLPVALELYRRDWKTALVRRVGGTFDYETSVQDSLVSTLHVMSGLESQTYTLPISESGYYFLRAGVRQPDGSTITAATGRRFGGESLSQAHRSGVTHLSLELDRTTAEPGDTVHAVFAAPPGGAQALVILESGGLVSARRMSLHGTPSVPVPLGGIAPPDASIAVLLTGSDRVPIAPAKGPRRSLPFFAQGSAAIEITPTRWRAIVDVRPDREVVGPGEEVEIEVRLTSVEGDPLSGEVTLAVVDEAVLALTRDQVSDPLLRLFTSRGSGTVYDETRFWLQLSPLREKGEGSPGGGGIEGPSRSSSPRSDFRPTAYWNPMLQVGADGVARVRVPMPDALTSYRIRATAVCEGDRHGVGEAGLRTDQPIVVEPAAPRFVRVGDRWTLGAVVENHTGKSVRVQVRCEIEGAELRGKSQWKGTVTSGMTARADFTVRSIQEGEIRYLLEAAADGDSGGDMMRGSLICVDPIETIPEITFGRAYPVSEEVLLLDDEVLASEGELGFRVAASLLSGLSEPIDYLIDYPHPCLEQRASRLLALLARRDLADRMPPGGPDPALLDSLLKAGVAELSSHMVRGSLSLWPDSFGGHPYLDGFVLYTLSRLRLSGVEVPDELYKAVWDIVRSRLESYANEPIKANPDTRAFLTYAMAAAAGGVASQGAQIRQAVTDVDLERLDAARGSMSAVGRLCLVLAMGEMRRQQPDSRGVSARRVDFLFDEVAQDMDRTARLASLSAKDSSWPWSSSQDDRVRATALAALFLSENTPSHPLLPSMVNWLLEQRERGRWRNTHENAWALEAVRSYAERAESLILPLQGRLIPGMSTGRGFRFTEGDLTPVEMSFTLEELSAFRRPDPRSAELPLKIEAIGQSALYYEMRLERRLRALEAPPREEGLIVFREYVEVESGEPTERLVRGEPLLVHLAVVVPWDTEYLILEDHLPAGVEALNLRLLTTSRLQPRSPLDGAGASQQNTWGRGRASERMPRGGSTDAPDLLPVSYRDLRDDCVILYADQVPAGVYHIYYPVAATAPGVYMVPGARAELMYSPEVFGSSGAARVEVR